MKWKIPVTWEVCGEIEVEADTLGEAMDEARINSDAYPLPEESEYVDGSFALSMDDEKSVMLYNKCRPSPSACADEQEGEQA